MFALTDVTELTFTDSVYAELVAHSGSDRFVAACARVSTSGLRGEDDISDAHLKGLINALMRNRHGSPFEMPEMTFNLLVPIFVMREQIRHRMSSVNEISARYRKLAPLFYVPGPDRPLTQTGKAMDYHLEPGTDAQHKHVHDMITVISTVSWNAYQSMLQDGVCREVARMVLPVNIFTECVWKVNLRSLMNYLSLRTHDDRASVVSHPQLEIQDLARQIEECFAEKFPITYAAWNDNGRVAP